MNTQSQNQQKLSEDRIKVLKKIEEFEKNGIFDQDVEDDPPSKPLMPDQVDYLNKKLKNKIATFFANRMAKNYFDKEIKKGNLIIKDIIGLENYTAVKTGAIITCNHFNPYDNYVVFKAIEKLLGKKRLYKIIREGNYTNFPGFYGMIFRHCNTLPLSSNLETMKKFLKAVDILLKRGEKILIYPEQGMWWNYKKPRPLKSGAFKFAVTSNVPVIPMFITMQDSNKLAPDGSYYQEHTLHILPAIYPDPNKSAKDNAKAMAQKNYDLWKQVYEETYKIPLTYLKKE